MKVVDQTGETWVVRRRWLPWRPRRRRFDTSAVADVATGFVDDVEWFVIVLVAVLVVLPVVLLLTVFVAELLLVLLLLPVFVIASALVRRRWPIEVARGRMIVHTESVKGWSASRERMMELADAARLATPSGQFDPGASSPA
jgi:hypothetical protein